MRYSSSHAWEKPVRLSEQGGGESDANGARSFSRHKAGRYKQHKGSSDQSHVEKLRKNTLCHALTPEKGTMRSGMEYEYPDYQFILNAFAGSSGSLAQR